MKLPLKERIFLPVMVAGLTAVLVTLAVLQYRWSREVSDATSARLQGNLETSMTTFRDDLFRELGGVFSVVQSDSSRPSDEKARQLVQQYQSWAQGSAHANLIADLYLWQNAGSGHSELLQLDIASQQFKAAEWPPEMSALHDALQNTSNNIVAIARPTARLNQQDRHGHAHGAPSRNPRPGAAQGPGGPGRRTPDFPPAIIDVNSMTLARLQLRRDGPQTPRNVAPQVDWIFVRLNPAVLQQHVLPELVERHFSGPQGLDYQVALLASPGQPNLIYSTDAGFGKPQDVSSADSSMQLFGRGPARRVMLAGAAVASAPRRPAANPPQHDRPDAAFAGPLRIDAMRYSGQDADWQVIARHRKGSLEAVVTAMRRKNLAISFGVLLVLGAGIALVVISSQRARTLARLQMDFVAAVSHELRTPLAVISSAADNINDGVVSSKQQVAQYGVMIKSQARQLIQLVEQILLFAATRQGRPHYNLQPLQPADLIETALRNTAGLIESASVTVVQEVAPNLPAVNGDFSALSHCLQNLITNAVKYGGEARWLRIRARLAAGEGPLDGVLISVEDKGLGISAAELKRIFEPFYRSPAVASAQIHGSGLGLPLAREIAEANGGKLTVTSEPGQGSCFTLYLPLAAGRKAEAGVPAGVVNPNLSKT